MQPVQQEWFTIDEAAAALRVSPDTIRRQVRDDLIPFRKVGTQYRIPGWWVRLGGTSADEGDANQVAGA